jgi:hypothetical protein
MFPGPASATPSTSACFDIYGYRVRIDCALPTILSGLADDFAFFASTPTGTEAIITLVEGRPDYTPWTAAKASAYTPRNVAYRVDGLTIIDYSGRGLAIHNTRDGSFHLSSLDRDLLYEAAYLFLLSQSGEALDRVHLHRVHALGICVRGRAALVLLPMGGGKSTLGSALLRHPEVQLLSDDSPLIDRAGNIHAFPLRIGLLPGSESSIPPEQLRTIQRMEFGPKLLVNYKFFADRVAPNAQPALVLLGERSLRDDCILRPASATAAWKAMAANCVVGMGLFQGMEFIFGRSRSEMAAKLAVVGSRASASRALLNRSGVYHLQLGRNIEHNAEVLLAALLKSAH